MLRLTSILFFSKDARWRTTLWRVFPLALFTEPPRSGRLFLLTGVRVGGDLVEAPSTSLQKRRHHFLLLLKENNLV